MLKYKSRHVKIILFTLLLLFQIGFSSNVLLNLRNKSTEYPISYTRPRLSLDEWMYSREITLNPTTPSNDYQIKIILDTINFNYSHASYEGRDIRFLDQNQNQLSYWIEEWDNSSSSIIWVKIPDSGTSTLTMYYGNPSAVSLSDGSKTFSFFDHFEGDSLNTSLWHEQYEYTNHGEIEQRYIIVYDSMVEMYLDLDPDVWGGYPPRTLWEKSVVGWNDFYSTGNGYGWKTPNGVTFYDDETLTRTGDFYEVNENVAAGEWIWTVKEINWINSSLIKFYEDDEFLVEHTNPDAIPSPGTLPIKFIFECGSSPNGYGYSCAIVSNDATLGTEGNALRMHTRMDWNEAVDDDILIFQSDWALIRKCTNNEPVATIGMEIIDESPPIINIINPVQDGIYGNVSPDFEINIFGASLNSTWYSLDNGWTNITFSGFSGNIDQPEWDKFGNGTVNIRFYANNSWGNESYSEISVRKDIIKPVISINSPIENELFGTSAPNFDLSVDEPNIDKMWYSLDNGVTNITFQSFTGTIDQAEWDKVGNGSVSVNFYVKDKGTNENMAEITIQKEIIAPTITINSPLPNNLYASSSPSYSVIISDPNLESMWYSLDDGATNFPFTELTGTIEQTEWNKHGNGTVTIKFFANDTFGNENYQEVMIRKDVIAPIITINSPQQDEIFSSIAPAYDITVVDSQLDSMWYTIDNGLTNIPITSTVGTIDQTEWNKRGGGNIAIRFYANDTLGNTVYSEVIIIKDIITPAISINTPNLFDVFGLTPPSFDLTVVEPNLDAMWYTLDGGITNFGIVSLSGTIAQTEWNKFGNGTVTIQFYASDLAGNIGVSQITIRKDLSLPLITILSPEMSEFAGINAPRFELYIQEPNIDTMWYTLDYGATKIYFSDFTGVIDQLEWDKHENGSVVVQFYVKDKGGNEAYSEVLVNKDIYAPIITIETPELGAQFLDYAPIFSISIQEPNIVDFWYSLDNGNTNITLNEFTGIIDQEEWDAQPNGPITIRFYARDKAGNIGVASVIVIKITTYIEPPPGIPGYNIIALIGVTLAVTLILIKRKLKK